MVFYRTDDDDTFLLHKLTRFCASFTIPFEFFHIFLAHRHCAKPSSQRRDHVASLETAFSFRTRVLSRELPPRDTEPPLLDEPTTITARCSRARPSLDDPQPVYESAHHCSLCVDRTTDTLALRSFYPHQARCQERMIVGGGWQAGP